MAAYTTIDDPSAFFKCHLYSGNGSTNAQTFADTDTDMQPDMVWIKSRSDGFSHMLYDAVRGVQKHIKPDSEAAEATDANSLTAFGSDGFTVGTNSDLNNSGDTYVAWCWKESATAGFDILSYSGTGSARTQAHSLSAKPNWIIVKKTSASGGSWFVYLTGGIPATNYVKLNETGATSASSSMWNNTEPTSSVFSLGTSSDVNGDGVTYVAYLWRSVQGFSKFGTYVGNGNADGPMVYTGFSPAYVVVKNAGGDEAWNVWNNKTPGYNVANKNLQPNSTVAEQTSSAGVKEIDFLSNGFKIRGSNTELNQSGNTHIYMAFAEAPFVNSNGVPCTAR
tara:strand:+ start:599 stop:1606 length:1008 start_codon:yes stop_codon:yes gene_type:complete